MNHRPGLPSLGALRLWYEFMLMSDRRAWSPYLRQFFGPRRSEPFEAWLGRVREDLELHESPLIQEHRSVADFEAHFAPDYPELHISVNLLAPKQALVAAFGRLLDDRHRTGHAQSITAATQLNGVVNEASLQKVLTVLKADRLDPKPSDVVIAREHLRKAIGKKPSQEELNVCYALISRYRRRGRQILEGIVKGRFPEPRRAKNDPAAPLETS